MKHEMNGLQKIVQSVKKDRCGWALILGNGFSYDGMKAAENEMLKQISRLQCENVDKGQESLRKRICQAVQKNDYRAVRTALYGDIWNGVSFSDNQSDNEEEQKRRRKSYAEKLAVRKNINLESYTKIDLCSLIKAFPGIILTTCQDETVEAFLEDVLCRTVDNQIYTPYSLATSTHWKQKLEKPHVLIKLYGTCTEPYRLLLSENDMHMYYPKQKKLPTVEVLDWIFQNKNLLFMGMDLEQSPGLAPGIEQLLKKKVSLRGNGTETLQRYILLEKTEAETDDSLYESLNIKKEVHEKEEYYRFICDLVQPPDSSPDSQENNNVRAKNAEKDGMIMAKEAAEELFWVHYNRRPRHRISKREKHILEKHILEDQNNKDSAGWNKKGVEMLAMAANNFAEFSDLWKTMKRYEKDNGIAKEQVIKAILNDRLDKRSRELHQILSFYGQGFPMGFLELMSENEEELETWKRAGIQLANSGIYTQSCDRNKMYEQMQYADNLVREAGINPHKDKFRHRLQERVRQATDTYFYLIGENIIKIENADEFDVEEKYNRMFGRIDEILKDKSDGYMHLHAMLETELPVILNIVKNLKGYKQKPELLYHLIRECRIQPEDTVQFLETVEAFQKEITGEQHDKNALCNKLMLYQVRIIAISRQQESGEEGDKGNKQKKALELCDEALNLIKKYEDSLCDAAKALLNESVFVQQIELYLLKSKISGKLASIREIERCHYTGIKNANYGNICEEQKKSLDSMHGNLKTANKLRENRGKITGDSYAPLQAEIEYLFGKYYFKRSCFWEENIRIPYYKDEMKAGCEVKNNSYEKAEKHYGEALKFYQKYPGLYRLQAAGVLRDMADLYCHKGKELKNINNEYSAKCYKCLEDAYMHYREYNNLHGIADVLQSMGKMEDFGKAPEDGRRSGICFYHAAAKLYKDLGDEWSHYVVSAFLKEAGESLQQGR